MSEERLLGWAMQIAAAEEMARAKVTFRPEVTIAQDRTKTVIKKETDLKIPATIIDEEGSGQLKELLIKSASTSWRIMVFADGQQLYNDSYDWFFGISSFIEEIAAFQDESGVYILHLIDIKFTKSLKVVVEPLVVASPNQENPKLQEVLWKLEITE